MDWQPIETAPKDGTWFVAVCCGEAGSYEVARYQPYHFYKFVEQEGGLFKKEINMTDEWGGANNMHRMTHWMPLPKPPST